MSLRSRLECAEPPIPVGLRPDEVKAFRAQRRIVHRLESQSDHRTTQMKEHISALKTQLNSFAPICRLPPEILARILHCTQVALTDDLFSVQTSWINFDNSWSRYTLACRRFRDVALHTPSLWTFLEIDASTVVRQEKWANLCATRARYCQSEITCDLRYRPVSLGALQRVLGSRDPGQIRKLKLKLEHTNLFGDTNRFILAKIMPALEDLELHMYGLRLDAQQSVSMTSYTSLRYLTIHDISLTHGSYIPDLPNLHTLDMSIHEIDDSKGLWSILSGSPDLETITIQTRNEVLLNFPPDMHIVLPRFRTLHVAGLPTSIAALVSVLPVPSRNFQLVLDDSIADGAQSWTIFSSVLHFWSKASPRQRLPEGRIVVQGGWSQLALGVPFVKDTAARSPQLYFECPQPHTVPPEIMSSVKVTHINAAEAPRFDVLGHCVPLIEHAVVAVNMSVGLAKLQPALDNWLYSRAGGGRPMKTVTFILLSEKEFQDRKQDKAIQRAVHVYMRKWKKERIVGSTFCELKDIYETWFD
jgi:hypothetical protein